MQKNKTAIAMRAVLILFVLFLSFSSADATDAVRMDRDSLSRYPSKPMDSIRNEALSSILSNYTDWHTAEIQGKLSTRKLPLSVTLRIYMMRGKAITISARAPFVGEVARIEISGDSIKAVYKLKRIYCEESFADLMDTYPGIVPDLQSLLLGHIVVFNDGEINEDNASLLDFAEIYENEDTINTAEFPDAWALTFPKGHTDDDSFGYDYIVNPSGLLESLVASLSTEETNVELQFNYDHDKKGGYNMGIALYVDEKQKFDAGIDFSAPKWNGAFPEPMKLNSKYKRLSIKQLLKAF